MITPHLVCGGASEAIEFYKLAFGAVEVMRLPMPNGKLAHASITINDSAVMLVDEMPERGLSGPKLLGGTSVQIHMTVPDVDATVARAVEAGATVILAVGDQFWGDRYGVIEDPFGHRWSIATPGKNVPQTTEDLTKSMRGGTRS